MCRSQTEAARLERIAGEAAPLALNVNGMPVLNCPQGHHAFLASDFPLRLLDQRMKHDESKLPASEARGWFVKQ